MKKIFLIIVVVIIFMIIVSVFQNRPQAILSRLNEKEEIAWGNMKFRIYLFGLFPVAEATLDNAEPQILNGKVLLYLKMKANTLPVFNKFYCAEATLESYIDKASGNPVFFKQQLFTSGKDSIVKELTYDQVNKIMVLNGIKRDILPDTQDPLSLVYNLITKDYLKKMVFSFNFNANQKNYLFDAMCSRKDGVVIANAKISRRDNNPYHKSEATFVFIEGKRNIPILFKIFASGAYLTVRLVEITPVTA